LALKYGGLTTIIEVNNSAAKLKMPNEKIKTLNINKLKHFSRGGNKYG